MSADKKCPRCGSANVEAGTLQSAGRIHFRPENAKFGATPNTDVFLRARMCLDCGAIDMVGDTHRAQTLTKKAA